MEKKDSHATPRRFKNPPGSPRYPHGFKRSCQEVYQYGLSMIRSLLGIRRTQANVSLPAAVPMMEILGKLYYEADSITWLGHASVLIQLERKNILVDPFLSTHAASIQPFGTRRVTPPGLDALCLPRIDFLLISHSHYDHCDRATLKELAHRRLQPLVIVPLGLGPLLTKWGFRNVRELDWHESASAAGITITLLPAIHHSRRTLTDYNKTLWGGFSIRSPRHSVYHAGDTGMGPIFETLGESYGPFDFGLVPIGGYAPEKILKSVHCNPEEAVALGKSMRCKQLLGIHWGALPLTDEPMDEPPYRFHTAAKASGYAPEEVRTTMIGETILL